MEASLKISSARGRTKKGPDNERRTVSGREKERGRERDGFPASGQERCEVSQIGAKEGGFARWVNNKNHPHNSSGQTEGNGRRRKRERLELLISTRLGGEGR